MRLTSTSQQIGKTQNCTPKHIDEVLRRDAGHHLAARPVALLAVELQRVNERGRGARRVVGLCSLSVLVDSLLPRTAQESKSNSSLWAWPLV
jgi:hypothetical protein